MSPAPTPESRPGDLALSVREHMALQLAATRYKYMGKHQADAIELLGWRPVRWWQVVDALLDDPRAEAAYPVEVHRLRRLRAARRAQRTARAS